MRRFLTGIALSCVTALPALADAYGDMLFLNQMNESYCTGNGGRWTGMTCEGGRLAEPPRQSIEQRQVEQRQSARLRDHRAVIERAVRAPLDPARFERRFPAVAIPSETEETAPLFACLRHRIAGLLLSEQAGESYTRVIKISRYGFEAEMNVRDMYYWTQDILALWSGDDRFLLNFDNAEHRQIMTDLVLQEAPRAWAELQAAVEAHQPNALLVPGADSRASWFLADTGLIYAAYEYDDPPVKLGRSSYYPASCKNHTPGSTYAKLIPVTGYFMDERSEAFAADPSGVRLEGVLPIDAP